MCLSSYNHRDNAKFKNSLVASFLSWVDYFRPRYGLMENVKNLVHNAKGAVLKYIVKTLVEIGYQVAVTTLQAGQYGVPQSRTRVIVIAAAPGEVLPEFPKPLYTFPSSSPSFKIDNILYDSDVSLS
jgi:DNA (cytosine-5)-methyltransferase 1